MHLLTTNKLELTFDVYSFAFESAGALEIANEYSGLAAPARPTTFTLDMCQYSLQNIASAGLRNM